MLSFIVIKIFADVHWAVFASARPNQCLESQKQKARSKIKSKKLLKRESYRSKIGTPLPRPYFLGTNKSSTAYIHTVQLKIKSYQLYFNVKTEFWTWQLNSDESEIILREEVYATEGCKCWLLIDRSKQVLSCTDYCLRVHRWSHYPLVALQDIYRYTPLRSCTTRVFWKVVFEARMDDESTSSSVAIDDVRFGSGCVLQGSATDLPTATTDPPYQCPTEGQIACPSSDLGQECYWPNQACDFSLQCPHGDDEKYCGMTASGRIFMFITISEHSTRPLISWSNLNLQYSSNDWPLSLCVSCALL